MRPSASVRRCLQRPAPKGRSQKPRSFPDPAVSNSVLPVVPPPLLCSPPNPTPNQAERYEEMVEYMKKVAVASDTDLSLEARSLHPLTM